MDTINMIIVDKTITNKKDNNEYLKYFSRLGKINLIPISEYTPSLKVDLVIFTGGADVSPELYGEKKGKHTNSDHERDKFEFSLFNTFKNRSILKVGICRGSQFLTVMNGGFLIQHVNGHLHSHITSTSHYGDFETTSSHHQMMYPFNLDPESYDLLGWSRNFRSTTYLDGENEEIQLSQKFLEPEIVYYKYTNCLAIQSHPEWEPSSPFSKLMLDIIKMKLNDR